jgi:hypothetical protein
MSPSDIEIARHWGEKAGWEDGDPVCPYADPGRARAWRSGFDAARAQKSSAFNCTMPEGVLDPDGEGGASKEAPPCN